MNFSAILTFTAACIALPVTSAAAASFKTLAEEQTSFVQAQFYDPAVGLYRPASPKKRGGLPYDFMWANGVQFPTLVGAARHNPAKYVPILKDFSNGLRKYWDSNAVVPGFDAYWSSPGNSDKYYDDNAWLVIAFAEAYGITKDKSYLEWAKETQKYVLSGWDDTLGGGVYWRETKREKNTCSNAPGAAGALCLYRHTKEKTYLEWALKIREWTRKNLMDTDGLFWDNINLDGRIERTKWTYNTALMIRTDVMLYEFTKNKQYLADARKSADAGIARWVNPETGSIADSAKFNHLFAEALLSLFDVTKDTRYLNVVRAHAAFGNRYVHDPKGGYFNRWSKDGHDPNAPKDLIENAAPARLLWLLAKYPDTDALLKAGVQVAAKGNLAAAETTLRNAAASDLEAVEPRYRLWKVLVRRKKTAEADKLADWMKQAAQNSDSARETLGKLGWKAPV